MVDYIIPSMLGFICLYALLHHVDIFAVFLEGAQKGLKTALMIMPTIVGLLTAVLMLRASGAIDWFAALMQPVMRLLGIPPECAALVLLKPVSGGGGLAFGSEIMKTCGTDSFAGRVAAVMLGASETSIYTISLYAGAVDLKNTRYALPAALIGDLTAFVVSAWMVRLLFGQ